MKKLLLIVLFLPTYAWSQKRSVDDLIDVIPRFESPYCTSYSEEELEKFKSYYPKNKLMSNNEDSTATEQNIVFAEILDRDAQLRLDSGLVKEHLVQAGERLISSDSHTDFFAYFGDAFVIDANGYYGMIIEKVIVNEGQLTSAKYLCTMTREGKLIDKIEILHSPEKNQSTEIPKKACIVNSSLIELESYSGKIVRLNISAEGKVNRIN